MKKILLVGLVLVVVGAVVFSGCLQSGTGTLVFKITDAPSALNITHANISISQVQVHLSAGGGNNSTAGWYTVVNQSQTFDLIALVNVTQFFGSATLSAGAYTQIRLTIDRCVITVNGTEYNCTIPSKTIYLIKPFTVKTNQTTTLVMDFNAQQSISETGSHKYIFKPVIKVIQE